MSSDFHDDTDHDKKLGVRCITCNRYLKEYRRNINSAMARQLMALSKFEFGNFIHINEILIKAKMNGSQIALLRHWGLVLQKPKTDEDKRTSGFWAITQKGLNFVQCRVKLPKYISLYQNEITDIHEEELVDILDVLGKKFSYTDLMSK